MVSFSCEVCNDTIIKKKLDQHSQRCYGAYFSCIDCSVTFQGIEYRNHTSCISEAEKYEKALYKGPKKQKGKTNVPVKKEQKVEPKEEPKKEEAKKEEPKKEESKKVTKSKTTSLDKFLKSNKEQNLYKVIKKASQDNSQDIKEFLKNIKVVKGEDGKIEII
jgi:cell growth-regulating nucleolar protein